MKRHSTSGEIPTDGDAIVRLPRRKTERRPLPPEGAYIGSGVYPTSGHLLFTGLAFTYWSPERPALGEIVRLCKADNQGNTLQFWLSGGELVERAREAAAAGLYATCIYSAGTSAEARALANLGASYIGFDFGERYVFGLYDGNFSGDRGLSPKAAAKVTLRTFADGFVRRVRADVDERHRDGWGDLMITSGSFALDYEIAGGIEVPCTEDCGSLALSSLARGLYRMYRLPLWGTHINHEWYSWIPHANPLKMETFRLCLYQKYLLGAKLIINESGNWLLQSSLCPDSPMHTLPRVAGDPPGLHAVDDSNRVRYEAPVRDEARKGFPSIDYRSPVARKYRKILSDFYDFCKANPAPAGQPETTIALAKGNFDLGSFGFSRPDAVAGAFTLAATNPNWMSGDPEASWNIVENVFFPRPPDLLAPSNNGIYGATPHGQADIVSFAFDNVPDGFLERNYRCLLFSGWNTCSPRQYKLLCDFVAAGGRLVLALAHLSCNERREYRFFRPDELVNGGDLTELCGLRVTGCGPRFYWATGPTREPNALGLACPRRYGIIGVPLGELEYAWEPSRYEVLAADDENFRSFILRCRQGRGEVFLVNGWAYPSAMNADFGPGATLNSPGLMGRLYDYVARLSRGHVWITGHDFETPDNDCRHILYSYFPEAGKICLLNIDFRNPRRFVLHSFGDKEPVELAPSEFRLLDAPVLLPHEMLNADDASEKL